MNKISKKKDKHLAIKVLAVTASITCLAAGFKLVYNGIREKQLLEENARLKQEFQDLLVDEHHNTHDEEKNIYESVNIGGRTINYMATPTPSLTPSPTPVASYPKYINVDSEEFIGAEDGVVHKVESKVKLDFYDENEAIAFYSKVFQLDDEKVGNKIYELIELDEDAWKEENVLNGKQYNTKEQAIARTIADISNYPKRYNLSASELEKKEYELNQYEPEELIYKFSDVIEVNPYIALAVAYGESGTKLNSYNFKHRYNVGGLHKRSKDPHPCTSYGLTIYKNEAEGLYRFVEILHNNFFVNRDSGYDRIKAMSYSYCEDPSYWRNLVGSVYYNLTNNGYDYYYNKFSYSRDLIYPTESKEYTI